MFFPEKAELNSAGHFTWLFLRYIIGTVNVNRAYYNAVLFSIYFQTVNKHTVLFTIFF